MKDALNKLARSPFIKLIADRNQAKGYLIIANSEEELKKEIEENGIPKHCLDVTLPFPNIKNFNYQQKTFTGLLKLPMVHLPFEDMKTEPSAFAKLMKEAEDIASKSIISDPLRAARPPEKSETAIEPDGTIVDMKKDEVPVVDTAKAGIDKILPEVIVEGFGHYLMKDIPNNDEAWFIGTYLKDQTKPDAGYYLIMTTPHEDFDKQMPVVFKKERAAVWVFSALLTHPVYHDIIASMAPFPLSNITAEDQATTRCIYVTDGLKFIRTV